ncbi:mevalonate kinase family protein [Legionella oakridgensis]|uniref:Mevalonate kinase n=2 Tax=Legionella oakridgensis TaxID=29423 RepID=W0BE84_9GAMM|nr:mevalonate kinase [Legionella oakridgensis]AHE68180.1 mevalonate kinase [Legionella oakridgensis ATCC 33761 = DSM 21215]ETO92267.1 mevalonate kinase [Legionella oakridgensis RV-2-2007]KTD39621.1 mevalonate kinase [Legionella oakridgensis]STY21143.1 mevalonate kinase [Legionella longbeachae]
MSYDFQTTTHGKWILAGEHSAIRGHSALVFPIHEKKLTLSYRQSTSELNADYEGESGADMHLLFWSVLEQGMQILGKSLNSLNGHFHLSSNIPIGVGMGASAALCVAVARWFSTQNMLTNWELHHFAKELEHMFHGQSSGLDIAGVASNTGIYFKQGLYSKIEQKWKPRWYLSSCGQIGITSHCIHQVKHLWETNPNHAEQIDQEMLHSVSLAQQALECFQPKSQEMLAQAINLAANCFQQWGLVSENLKQHMETLRNAGAIAVKPTGSGGGGYMISLWDPNITLPDMPFIPV